MKHRWTRICIVWLLAAMLPVQALASALMLHCAPAVDASRIDQVHVHESGKAGHGEHHAHQVTDDGHAGQSVAAAGDAGTDAPAVKCSSCAPCGSAAAPQPSVCSIDAVVIVAIMHGPGVQLFRSADVFLPDRPPRTTLA